MAHVSGLHHKKPVQSSKFQDLSSTQMLASSDEEKFSHGSG
jgi:hypothetical protein